MHSHDDQGGLLEYRDLESQVLPSYWRTVLDWLCTAAADVRPRRVLDLGAGTGFAALALAQRFIDAEVIALDVDADALARVRDRTGDELAARVSTLAADLDAGWPNLGGLDLTWASMSLHHLTDPDRVLRDLAAATRSGGLVAVAEAGEQLRVLPDDVGVGRPGLEQRCLDAQAAEHVRTLPMLGSDWAARLRTVGFTVLEERTFALDETPPVLPATARYAQLRLDRLRSGLGDELDAADVDAIAVLLDQDAPQFVGRRTDFAVRGSRVVTLARTPS